MRTFMHFVMEELFMVRKLALVKEIRRFDSEMAKMITSAPGGKPLQVAAARPVSFFMASKVARRTKP